MKEIQDFIAKAERFLQSAEHLQVLEDYDSCVSKCCYAMFYMAEAALMTKGVTASSHRGSSAFLENILPTQGFSERIWAAFSAGHLMHV